MFVRIVALVAFAAVLSPAQPRFALDGGLAFDFGELYTTSPVEKVLSISNTGTDTLRITNVSGSCGCTGTLLSSGEIPPGGDATLKITFDPAKFRGKVQKVVSMKTNDPAALNPHVTFSATITHILELDQTRLVYSTKPDSEATVIVTVRNLSDVPVRITGVTSSSPELVPKLSGSLLQPGEATQVRCSNRPKQAGIVRGDVTLTTDHPLIPELKLPFFSYARIPASSAPGSRGK